MKKKLLSLQSSGESVEKAISIYYTSLQTNEKFYSNYKTIIFYGHNLPKKNMRINVHGTVGFYVEYLSDIKFVPECSKKYLMENANAILERLCLQGYISERNWNYLLHNKNNYWEFIKKLPFEYLYPQYYVNLIQKSSKLLNIGMLMPLFLEDNWPKVVSGIDSDFARYSIYALEPDGNVGRYYIHGNVVDDYILAKNLFSKASLSGNSAILLSTIGHRIGERTIVGYRPHKRSLRPNRNYALNMLLDTHESIIEPSNIILSQQFDLVSNALGDEEKTNIVYAKVFRKYLEDNSKSLVLM